VQDWLTQSQRSQTIQAQNKAAAAKMAGVPATSNTSPQVASKVGVTTSPAASPAASQAASKTPAIDKTKAKSVVKLSYKEQRELESLPSLIAELEEEQKQIREAMSDSELFAKDPARATALYERDAQIDVDLMAALERWEILSAS
jgi:ATP-binding cassette subfamily F protein uup